MDYTGLTEYVVGIDASTVSIAFTAGFDEENTISQKMLLKNTPDRPLQAFRITRRFMHRITSNPYANVELVALEAPLMNHKNVQAALKQSVVSGAIQAALCTFGVTIDMVQPNTWKKRALGFGQLSKDEVKERVHGNWPYTHAELGNDQDLIDSFAIYVYALRIAQISDNIETTSEQLPHERTTRRVARGR
jgi:Holliday junction resolvasome RuvABC endonuclease subunit